MVTDGPGFRTCYAVGRPGRIDDGQLAFPQYAGKNLG